MVEAGQARPDAHPLRIAEARAWHVDPDDAGRGVPYPDMILTALLGLDLDDVRSVLVVGDTAEDMTAGRRAGAGLVVGVRTGRDADDVLLAAGADRVVPGLADVPDLVVRTR